MESYRLDDPEILHWVLGQLDELVLEPVDGAGGSGIVIGPRADEATLDVLRAPVAAQPRGWIAQQPVALSTSPVLIGRRWRRGTSTCGRSRSTTGTTSGCCPAG